MLLTLTQTKSTHPRILVDDSQLPLVQFPMISRVYLATSLSFNQHSEYADDITVWASGVKIPELEHKINGYLTEMACFLRDNSLLISAPKSTVTLFTPDPKQANTHLKIKISGAYLPLVRNPKLLGVYLDTFFSFNTHCVQVANRVSKRNNVLKALAGTNWGQQKETLLLTYKALGRSLANYGAPVWSTNASDTSLGKIQLICQHSNIQHDGQQSIKLSTTTYQ